MCHSFPTAGRLRPQRQVCVTLRIGELHSITECRTRSPSSGSRCLQHCVVGRRNDRHGGSTRLRMLWLTVLHPETNGPGKGNRTGKTVSPCANIYMCIDSKPTWNHGFAPRCVGVQRTTKSLNNVSSAVNATAPHDYYWSPVPLAASVSTSISHWLVLRGPSLSMKVGWHTHTHTQYSSLNDVCLYKPVHHTRPWRCADILWCAAPFAHNYKEDTCSNALFAEHPMFHFINRAVLVQSSSRGPCKTRNGHWFISYFASVVILTQSKNHFQK